MAGKNKSKEKASSSGSRKFIRWILVLIGLGVLGVAAVAATIFVFSIGLPTLESVEDYEPKEVTRVYAAKGEVIASWADEERIYRTVLTGDEIPDIMRKAMIAAEDSQFYSHPGLDAYGLLRAIYVNIKSGSLKQGASTITQQVVKNLVLSPERSFRRKIREAILAWRLEDSLDKDEILTIYLNEVFFGSHFYGIEEASQYYFGHSARELSVIEAATLAGLVQSPNAYNPHYHPERAKARRHYVLRRMYEEGMIEEGVYRDADAQPLGLANMATHNQWEGQFAYYVDAVRRAVRDHVELEEDLGAAGLRIETTLDIDIQQKVVAAVRQGLRRFDQRHGVHTPYGTPETEAERQAWIEEHANQITTEGLQVDEKYRALIVKHTEEETLVRVGPYTLNLSRNPESRLKPEDMTWEEAFPVGSAFTVVSHRDVPANTLEEAAPGEITVEILERVQAAAVVMDPTSRAIVALVGGYDFATSPYNRAVQARRQVGSAFKPIVYGAAIAERDITAATIFKDQPITFRQPNGESWRPQNYDGDYEGEMTVRKALAKSRNVIAVRVLDLVGLDVASEFAERMGIDAELPNNLTLALGSAELTPVEATNAFATYAAKGFVEKPYVLSKIVGGKGKVLYEHTADAEPGITEPVAWLMTDVMTSVVTEGTAGRAARVGHPIAGKTGTTNGPRDAWFIGYSPYYVAGVWVGYDSNQELGSGESGGGTALPIWTDFMQEVHKSLPIKEFPEPPEGIEQAEIDEESGLLAAPSMEGRTEYFLDGTAPVEVATPEEERSVEETILHGGGVPVGTGDTDEGGAGSVQDGF